MSTTSSEKRKPMIVTTKYSNYLVTDLETLKKADGTSLKTDPVTALCRCGHSKHKPFCDGTHNENGLNEVKKKDRLEDRVKTYEGANITIYDNRGVCSHDESCTRLLPAVFDKDKRPWIDPDGASVAEIIDTIEKCPSGALSYGIGSRRYQEMDREPAIQTTKNGPLKVTGGIILKDDQGCQPECREHYTLCRCGESKNKPFCDGSHDEHDFKAD
ncbi:MAG: CDGSH iron-sulfur domain-containing protein [Bacillota bacterium]|nr:CDGSH iron-sulfur domain-containing protein [Bacillota bacterium]MDW7677707.1 CDGSH iron-sulfur domain-containing protein [Bacillota bacterium]